MRVIIGSDNLGYPLKQALIEELGTQGIDVEDCGVYTEDPVDYPDIAAKLAHRVAQGEFERGILICGTGIGMAIAANKVHGIRAAVCHDLYSAQRARMSNNAQIMALGALVVGPSVARELVRVWLSAEFAGGASARKVEKMMMLENHDHEVEAVG